MKTKERVERRLKKAKGTFNEVEWTTQSKFKQENKAKFNDTWSIVVIKVLVKDSTTISKYGFKPISKVQRTKKEDGKVWEVWDGFYWLWWLRREREN